MEIRASSISIFELLTGEGEFSSSKLLVPEFQRNYAWDPKHVKDLLDSINDYDGGYYIGNVIIQAGRGTTSKDLIIDGQQRLTTIYLILKALGRLGLKRPNKNKLEDLLFFNKKKELLRINFTRTNLNNAFSSIIVDDDLSEENFSDENSKKFLKNYNYIKKELRNLDNINNFFSKVVSLSLVVIKFGEGYNVNQLFEGLNSKGKILSAIQLTKNALIGAVKNDETTRNAVINIWESLEKSFEESRKIVWFDKFLRHFGFERYGYVSCGNLFTKINNELRSDECNVLNFSKELKNNAELYLKIRTAKIVKDDISAKVAQKEWGPIEQIILNLSRADLDQVYSVLFSTISHAKTNADYVKPKGVAQSRFLHDLKRIWAFSILAKYLDVRPSLYETKFANFSHSNLNNQIRKGLFDFLIEIIKGQNRDKFARNINERIKITGDDNKKINSQNDRNFVLQLLVTYLEDGKRFAVEDLTIEHIIPIGKKDGLKKWKNISKKYINRIEHYDRYKFGNLTLLQKDTAGNEVFDKKLEQYSKDYYKKKHRLLNKYRELFNSENPGDAVNKRGEEVACSLYDILVGILNK